MSKINSYKEIITTKFFSKIAIEFGPIILFAISFHIIGPFRATTLLMLTTVISTIMVHRLDRRIPYITLYVTFLTILFGYFTLHKHSFNFIQMRDSVYDFTLALTLIVGIIFNLPLLKIALSSYVDLKDRAWKFFTYLWTAFFFSTGLLNEFVRHHYTVSGWVDYKIVMIFVTLLFTFVSLEFTLRQNNKE